MKNNTTNTKDMSDTANRSQNEIDGNHRSSVFSTIMTCITDYALEQFRLFVSNLNGVDYDTLPESAFPQTQAEVNEKLDTTIKNTLGESKETKQAPPESETKRTDNPQVCRLCGHTQPEGWDSTTCFYNMINIHSVCQTEKLKPLFQTEEHNPETCEECITIKKYRIANSRMLESQPKEYYFDKQGKNANLVKAGKDPHRRYNGVIIRDNVISELGPETVYIDTFKLDSEESESEEQIQRVKLQSKGVAPSGQSLGTESVEEAIGMRHPTEDRIFVNGPRSIDPINEFYRFVKTGGVEGEVPMLNANDQDNKAEQDRLNAVTFTYDTKVTNPDFETSASKIIDERTGAIMTNEAELVWKVAERSPLRVNQKRRKGVMVNTPMVTKKVDTVCKCVSKRQSFHIPLKINIGTDEAPEYYECGSQYDFDIVEGAPSLERKPTTWTNRKGEPVTTNSLSGKCGTCGKDIVHEEGTFNVNEYLKNGNTLPYGLGKIEASSICALPPTTKTSVGIAAVKELQRQKKLNEIRESLVHTPIFGEDPECDIEEIDAVQWASYKFRPMIEIAPETKDGTPVLTESYWNIAPLMNYGGDFEQLKRMSDSQRTILMKDVYMIKALEQTQSADKPKISKYKSRLIQKMKTLYVAPTTAPADEEAVWSEGLPQPQKSDYGSGPEVVRHASELGGMGIITKKAAINTWRKYVNATKWQSNTDLELDSTYWKHWSEMTRQLTKTSCKFGEHEHRPIIIGIVGASKIPSSMKARFKADIEETLKDLQQQIGKSMIVLSGGARGVDEFSVQIAKKLRIPTIEFNPENQSWDEGYKSRNNMIAMHSHRMLNFVLKKGVYKKCPAPVNGEFPKCAPCKASGKKFCMHTWSEVKYDDDCHHCIESKSYKDGKNVEHCKSGGCYTALTAKGLGCGNVTTITCDEKSNTKEVLA